jgi:DNA-binding transcriptional LysR family regulator
MNTLYFRYAVEVERSRSITQAAENLFMAQPNLSKAIKELEDSLGITIFERTPKGVIPTKKGAEFLVYAKNILSQINKMEALGESDSVNRQRFSISIPRGSYITSALTDFVSGLDPKKEMELNIQETNSMQIITNVTQGQFNLGIIRFQNIYENYFIDYLAEKHLSFDVIWEYEVMALMSKYNILAEKDPLQGSDFKNLIEIIHGDNVIPYLNSAEMKKREQNSNGLSKRVYVYERCTQFDLLCKVPSTYMWVSPIPQDILNRYELVQRKCSMPNNKYKDLIIYPKEYEFSALDRKFIDLLYKAKNEVAYKNYH